MRILTQVIGMGVLLSCVCQVPAQDFVVTTVAGGALPSTPAPATNVSIHYPQDVAVDSAGNVYTSTMNAVFKMDKNGVLTRLAGASSASGYSGDGGPATSARLNSPLGIAVDVAGNVYVADTGNSVVRRVATDGSISTVVGNGNFGTAGDGGPAASASLMGPTGLVFDSSGNLYIADGSASQIRKVTTDGIIHTILSGTLSYPNGLAIDASGNLYIADTNNDVIRKLAPDGTLTIVAGITPGGGFFNGDGLLATVAALNGPYGVALDAAGNLYIADSSNYVIRRVGSDGIIQSVVGRGNNPGFSGDGGAAANALLMVPGGICFDKSGVLYIADVANSRIRKVTAAGTISTIIGGGQLFSGDGNPATSVQLNSPFGSPVVIGGDLFVADSQNNRIRKVAADGTITTVAGTGTAGFSGDNGPATSAQLNLPYSLAADSAGNLYVVDANNPAIRKITPGGTITTVARGFYPTAIALDPSGNIYFTSPSSNLVYRISSNLPTATPFAGRYAFAGASGDGGPATQALLWGPSRRCGRQCGKRLHRRHAEQPNPQGVGRRNHHELRRQWHTRLFRRWRPGHKREPVSPPERGGRFRRQRLHRGHE